jgi:hypothetical protein
MPAKRCFDSRIGLDNASDPFLITSGQIPVLYLLIYCRAATISFVSDGNGGLVAALCLSSSKVNSTFPIHCMRPLRAANGELG